MSLLLFSNYRKPYEGILHEPDKRLRRVSKKVDEIDSTVIEVANKLIGILERIDKQYIPWLGMAAPQIGINLRIIAIKRSFQKYQVMINPEFSDQKWFLPTISGCYSLKGLYLLKSPYWIKINYLDLQGKKHKEVFQGGMAVLLKQEIDHLDGKLICD